MSTSQAYRVGTLHVTEPTKVQELFECAAWEREVLVQPGDYPVVVYPYWPEKSPGHTLYAQCEGTITYATFQAIMGAQRGADHGPEEVGQTKRTSIKIPTYAMHKYVESGELELIEGRMVASPVTESGNTFYRMGEYSKDGAEA